MKSLLLLLIGLVLCTGVTRPTLAQSCESSPQRHAHVVHGEIAGKRTFIEPVAGGWVFKLEPSQYGWEIRLRDADQMDLTQTTPPFHLAPNPREIHGWHFRNAANTGENTGDVNAPQHLRLFQYLAARAGFALLRLRQKRQSLIPTADEARSPLQIWVWPIWNRVREPG